MIKRSISDRLLLMAEKYPVISVMGSRQSGKSTLLKQLFAEYRYVTLEDSDSRRWALDDHRLFLSAYSDKVIIDKIQRAPELFSYMQGKVINLFH